MMSLKLDSLDVLGAVLTSSVPATLPAAPDFAQMVAVAAGVEQFGPPAMVEPELPAMATLSNNGVVALDPNKELAVDNAPSLTDVTATAPGTAALDPDPVQSASPQLRPPKQENPQPKAGLLVRAEEQLATENAPAFQTAGPQSTANDFDSNQNDDASHGEATAESELPTSPILAPGPVALVAPAMTSSVDRDAPSPTLERMADAQPKSRAPKAIAERETISRRSNGLVLEAIKSPDAPSLKERPRPLPVQVETAAPPATEIRTAPATLTPAIERALPTLVERMVAFNPALIDAARDLAQMGDARDMRFNIRPETLGPVAVSIERTDAGQNLRLGVETAAAVHAVRQAEPTFNDPRTGNPFVNVTVDLTSSDQRGRPLRAVPAARQQTRAIPNEDRTAHAIAGRYA